MGPLPWQDKSVYFNFVACLLADPPLECFGHQNNYYRFIFTLLKKAWGTESNFKVNDLVRFLLVACKGIKNGKYNTSGMEICSEQIITYQQFLDAILEIFQVPQITQENYLQVGEAILVLANIFKLQLRRNGKLFRNYNANLKWETNELFSEKETACVELIFSDLETNEKEICLLSIYDLIVLLNENIEFKFKVRDEGLLFEYSIPYCYSKEMVDYLLKNEVIRKKILEKYHAEQFLILESLIAFDKYPIAEFELFARANDYLKVLEVEFNEKLALELEELRYTFEAFISVPTASLKKLTMIKLDFIGMGEEDEFTKMHQAFLEQAKQQVIDFILLGEKGTLDSLHELFIKLDAEADFKYLIEQFLDMNPNNFYVRLSQYEGEVEDYAYAKMLHRIDPSKESCVLNLEVESPTVISRYLNRITFHFLIGALSLSQYKIRCQKLCNPELFYVKLFELITTNLSDFKASLKNSNKFPFVAPITALVNNVDCLIQVLTNNKHSCEARAVVLYLFFVTTKNEVLLTNAIGNTMKYCQSAIPVLDCVRLELEEEVDIILQNFSLDKKSFKSALINAVITKNNIIDGEIIDIIEAMLNKDYVSNLESKLSHSHL